LSKVAGAVRLAVGAVGVYRAARVPRNWNRWGVEGALAALAAAMGLVAVGFGLAAAYGALRVLGSVAACGITAVIALAVGLVALAALQRMRRRGR
jgi:hypothetical protein